MYTVDNELIYIYDRPKCPGAAAGYAVKRISSGPMIEYEIFPSFRRPQKGVRNKKMKPTSQKLKQQNEKNAGKLFIRLLNANFGGADYHFTGTTRRPDMTISELKRTADNFISRWQYARKKAGLQPGKYIFVLEKGTERTKRLHVHFVLEGGLSRDEIESKWKHGRASCQQLQPDEFGLEGLGRYLMKDPKGRKRWYACRNLKRPKVTVSYMRRSEAERIARNAQAAAEYFKRRDSRAKFLRMDVAYSDIVPGAYMHIVTRRDDRTSPPNRKKRIGGVLNRGTAALPPKRLFL